MSRPEARFGRGCFAVGISTDSPLFWIALRIAVPSINSQAVASLIHHIILQVRGTLLTASQCATYDDTKRIWMQTTGWRDGLGTHVGVSMITGEVLIILLWVPSLHPALVCWLCGMRSELQPWHLFPIGADSTLQ